MDLFNLLPDVRHTRYHERELGQKICVFNSLLGTKELILYLPQLLQHKLHNILWTLTNLSLKFLTLNSRRKKSNMFSIGWLDFYSKRFVFHNLLGVREVILSLAADLPKYLVEPNKKTRHVPYWALWKRNGPKSFFFGTIPFVLKKFGSQFLRSQRNDHIAGTLLVKILCVPLKIVPWRLSYSLTRIECRPTFYFHWKRKIFQEFVISATSHVLKKWFYNFRRDCQNTLWTFTFCSLRFVTINNLRKKGLNCFPLEGWPFFKKLCFQQTLGCYRKDLITCTIYAKRPRGN